MEHATPGGSHGGVAVCGVHQPRECASDFKKNELKPWQVKSWMIPEAGLECIYTMEDGLEVYAQPYDPLHPKVCLDKSPQQLIGERREAFTDEHGVLHMDYEYTRKRNGGYLYGCGALRSAARSPDERSAYSSGLVCIV